MGGYFIKFYPQLLCSVYLLASQHIQLINLILEKNIIIFGTKKILVKGEGENG